MVTEFWGYCRDDWPTPEDVSSLGCGWADWLLAAAGTLVPCVVSDTSHPLESLAHSVTCAWGHGSPPAQLASLHPSTATPSFFPRACRPTEGWRRLDSYPK